MTNQQIREAHLACQAAGKALRANILYTDRSRIEAREKCPRLRELGYEIKLDCEQDLGGIQLKARSVPLATGIAVHEGLAELAKGETTDTAVATALSIYSQQVTDRGFSSGIGPQSGNVSFIIAEQSAIVEALVRIGGLRILPSILNSGHKIVSIEKERITWLGEDEETNTTVLYLSRADLEMYDPDSNQLYVINYKTAKSWQDYDQDKLIVNRQTLGEPAALGAALRAMHLYPELMIHEYLIRSRSMPCSIAGVQYIVLLKGDQRYDASRGHEVTYSHLTRAWTNIDHATGRQNYTWRYYHQNSKRQVLSKATGFHPFESYPGGTKQWIKDLADGKIMSGENEGSVDLPDPLSESVVMPAMCYAHPERLENWQQQVVRDELRWSRDKLENRPSSQHTHACGSGKWRCQFWQICHELIPVSNEYYEPRMINHETES